MIDFAKTTVLFGGSFDPVHRGHLHAALAVLNALPEVQQLLFVPCRQAAGKAAPIGSPELRLELLKLALEGVQDTRLGLWDEELRREGPSYTVDTLAAAAALGARKEKLYWLMGADAYDQLPQWKDPARIRSFCRLLVVNRPETGTQQSPQDVLLTIPPSPLSSTAVRETLQAGGKALSMLPARVFDHLCKLSLMSHCPYGSVKRYD